MLWGWPQNAVGFTPLSAFHLSPTLTLIFLSGGEDPTPKAFPPGLAGMGRGLQAPPRTPSLPPRRELLQPAAAGARLPEELLLDCGPCFLQIP